MTDAFTDAADDAAEQSARGFIGTNEAAFGYHSGFTAGAEWARTHLAAQEPTDAELDAAYAAFTAHSRTGLSEDRESNETVCVECGYATIWPFGYRTEKRAGRHAAREAILAARAARRDEEKR